MRIGAFLAAIVLGGCSPRPEPVPYDSVNKLGNLPSSPAFRTYARYVRYCPPTLADPPTGRAMFDVHVRRRSRESTAARVDDVVRAIERLGGHVVHRFHVGVIRAELDTAAARVLTAGPESLAHMAEQVREPGNRNLSVQITFNRPPMALDSERVARLGGAPGPISGTRDMLYATVADSALPGILVMEGVEDVRTRVPRCGQPG